jgi:hypothetical protein
VRCDHRRLRLVVAWKLVEEQPEPRSDATQLSSQVEKIPAAPAMFTGELECKTARDEPLGKCRGCLGVRRLDDPAAFLPLHDSRVTRERAIGWLAPRQGAPAAGAVGLTTGSRRRSSIRILAGLWLEIEG